MLSTQKMSGIYPGTPSEDKGLKQFLPVVAEPTFFKQNIL